MQVQLTFRQMDPTFEIEEQIFKEARRLDRVYPQKLTWCHVVIERPHRHKRQGGGCHVHVQLQGVWGYHVAGSDYDADAVHENPHVAITGAFQAVHSQMRSNKLGRENERVPGLGLVDLEAQSCH
jgi:ribosome-associated translation inhibitor RaiA